MSTPAFNYSAEPNPKQAVPDSSVASGTDRGVSQSVAEVSTPAGPSSDPYKRVQDFFNTIAEDEPDWYTDLRDNMMEMYRDAFADNMGKAVPQTEYKPLGIGYGPLGGQQFPEACAFELMLGPQGEPVYEPREPRFNEAHDEKGQFTSGGSTTLYEKTFGKVGDTKTADEVVSSIGNKQAYAVLGNSSDGMSMKFTLKEVPVDSITPTNATETETVEKYADKKTEAPPIVIHKDEVIDGNHRLAAAKARGDKTIKAYVSNTRYMRFNEAHGEAGRFTSAGTVVKGDTKTTIYNSPVHQIVVEHDTAENKITIKHLDKEGNLLVQQTHDSVSPARKELQSQGIDHKFYRAVVKPGPMCYRSASGEVMWC